MTRLSRRNTLKLLLSGTTAIVAGAALTPRQLLADTLSPDTNSALIVIDVQNCFVPGGTLPVADGKAVVPVINHLAPAFDNIVITQDWRTPEHASFPSSYDTKQP